MPRSLITGITGMVGSHLADYLLANTDWEVCGLYRWRSPLDNISHIHDERMSLFYGDLHDSDSINGVVYEVKPDYVFHLAAQSYPKTSFNAALDTYDANIHGLSLIHISEPTRQAEI